MVYDPRFTIYFLTCHFDKISLMGHSIVRLHPTLDGAAISIALYPHDALHIDIILCFMRRTTVHACIELLNCQYQVWLPTLGLVNLHQHCSDALLAKFCHQEFQYEYLLSSTVTSLHLFVLSPIFFGQFTTNCTFNYFRDSSFDL